MSEQDAPAADFAALGLPASLAETLAELGYTQPTPIQAQTIPALLEGRDVLGQAQTGTGKTAAFALPLLTRLEFDVQRPPQLLVLTPTRELAIQVADAFNRYGASLPGLRVATVYGGAGYGPQLRDLRAGAQVVVGTPGRVMDHMERGSLDLSALRALVLDEADEMLRMGFVDDVEHVLSAAPPDRQLALFSATMPPPIRAIARRHLQTPVEVTVRARTLTADTVAQYVWGGPAAAKLEALTRIVETADFDAMLIFVRTRVATAEVAAHLNAHGLPAAALSGELDQHAREAIVEALRDGRLRVVVATDVAARGLDVDRISHVINYELPPDAQTYTHRIGRTGRAGRTGAAILFVTGRPTPVVWAIEKAAGAPLRRMDTPGAAQVNAKRLERLAQRIETALDADGIAPFEQVLTDYAQRTGTDPLRLAAAMARLAHGDTPLLLPDDPPRYERAARDHDPRRPARDGAPRDYPRREAPGRDRYARDAGESRPDRGRAERQDFAARSEHPGRPERDRPAPGGAAESYDDRRPPRGSDPSDARPPRPARPPAGSADVAVFRVEVGRTHGAEPGKLMGAIANEGGLSARQIGRIRLHDEHSTVELPAGLAEDVLAVIGRAWVCGRQLRLRRDDGPAPPWADRGPGRDFGRDARRNSGRTADRAADRGSDRSAAREWPRGADQAAGDAGAPRRVRTARTDGSAPQTTRREPPDRRTRPDRPARPDPDAAFAVRPPRRRTTGGAPAPTPARETLSVPARRDARTSKRPPVRRGPVPPERN